jgi:branched-subunit amino acid aminotransferase/4-amino-4-deoxychorismate lyase
VHKALTAPQRHTRKRNRNYGPTVLSQKEAEKMGYNQILWLYGPDHQVTEVGTMNMFVAFQHKNGISLNLYFNIYFDIYLF